VPSVVSLPDWTTRAACLPLVMAGEDLWHPDDELPRRVQEVMFEAARAICVTCPVQVQCGRQGLELLETDSVDGMYGGMVSDEMREIARKVQRSPRRVAQHGTRSRYVNYRCRCLLCRAANSVGEADRRTRKTFYSAANS
jgi:Transcription factor WhiB